MKNYLLKSVISAGFFPILFVSVLWLVFLVQNFSSARFIEYGILPRTAEGIKGVVTSVFIHGDLGHLASNSLPLIALGMMLFHFYRKIALPVFMWIWLISGLWLWIGGRSSEQYPMRHIGASTLIYGLATFLFFSGLLRRHKPLMVVSALVVFLYGSIMWGIFPLKAEISWEGHLFGAVAGLLVAYNYRKEGPQRRIYQWEEEDEDDDAGQPWNSTPPEEGSDEVRINYIYIANKNPPSS